MDASAGVEWATWWGGGAFNHAAASVDRRARLEPGASALVWEGEDGEVRTLTNAELRDWWIGRACSGTGGAGDRSASCRCW
jgi:acyl-coenzyme A synthetase/AMP-(fatty) acid ligase